jgi:hypothetical protein
LVRFSEGQLVPVFLPGGKVLTEVQAMTKDRAGGLRLRDPHAGLFRLAEGKLTSISSLVSSFTCLLSDRSGHVWIAENGKISYYQDGQLHALESQDGAPSGAIYVLYQDRGGTIWAGGEDRLAKFDNGRFRKISKEDLSSVSRRMTTAIGGSPPSGASDGKSAVISKSTIPRIACRSRTSSFPLQT